MEHAHELQTRWDKAVAAATQKLQETRQSKGSENAAEEIGGEGVQYSISRTKNQINSEKDLTVWDEKKTNDFLRSYGYKASQGVITRLSEETISQNSDQVNSEPHSEWDNRTAL